MAIYIFYSSLVKTSLFVRYFLVLSATFKIPYCVLHEANIFYEENLTPGPSKVAHTYNTSHSGDRQLED
jgi:hypothetical protein